MTHLLTETDWVAAFTREGWEVNRLDKSTWGPALQAATDTAYRRLAHFPDLVLARGGQVMFVDCAGGRHGFDHLPARVDKVVAHRHISELFGVPVWHAWATGHYADITTISEHGHPGKKNPNGHYGDGSPFLLVPVAVLDQYPLATSAAAA